jgi:hypothetical protein
MSFFWQWTFKCFTIVRKTYVFPVSIFC